MSFIGEAGIGFGKWFVRWVSSIKNHVLQFFVISISTIAVGSLAYILGAPVIIENYNKLFHKNDQKQDTILSYLKTIRVDQLTAKSQINILDIKVDILGNKSDRNAEKIDAVEDHQKLQDIAIENSKKLTRQEIMDILKPINIVPDIIIPNKVMKPDPALLIVLSDVKKKQNYISFIQ
jgi:hypothetical protein